MLFYMKEGIDVVGLDWICLIADQNSSDEEDINTLIINKVLLNNVVPFQPNLGCHSLINTMCRVKRTSDIFTDFLKSKVVRYSMLKL